MKRVSIAACCGIALGMILSLTTAGYTQGPCQSPDEETPGAAAVPSRSLKAFQEATPEALRAFRELNLNPPMGRIVGGDLVLIENNPWQIAMVRASVAEPTRSQFCGGSIIGDTWILTAAHCVRNSISPRRSESRRCHCGDQPICDRRRTTQSGGNSHASQVQRIDHGP